jgi:hypothetical protein
MTVGASGGEVGFAIRFLFHTHSGSPLMLLLQLTYKSFHVIVTGFIVCNILTLIVIHYLYSIAELTLHFLRVLIMFFVKEKRMTETFIYHL